MKKLWFLWLVLTVAVATYYGMTMFISDDKTEYLIGDTSHGHYQIEMACTACHTEAFGGEEVLQGACVECHQQELDDSHDSHPKKKFTDPRNADRLAVVDARYCISCHTEHKEDQIGDMGVSLPKDYCYHCHQDIGDDRESHKGLAFDSCASSGCHNYHDNKALYENFLVEHAAEPWLKGMDEIIMMSKEANAASRQKDFGKHQKLVKTNAAFNEHYKKIKELPESHFDNDRHIQEGLSCNTCHLNENTNNESISNWVEKPGIEVCSSCHAQETDAFKASKHGMRLAQSLSAMNTQLAKSVSSASEDAFHQDGQIQEQGCNACHTAHNYDRKIAATQSCLSCHSDEHSRNFQGSKHAELKEVQLLSDGSTKEVSMSCAFCHMPHVTEEIDGISVTRVEHNQSLNLRSNEKMIRTVCMNCHGLAFSIDALADELLIKNNFSGQPANHIPSIDWAVERNKE